MPLLKVLNESYRNEDALENLIYYVCRSGHVGGVGVDPEYARMQMSMVKRLWHKETGRQAWHFILAFAPNEDVTYEEAMAIGYAVAGHYGERYQIVFGLHFDTNYLHLHFAGNTVSFVDGQMRSEGYADFAAFRNYVQSLMPQWDVKLVVEHSSTGKSN